MPVTVDFDDIELSYVLAEFDALILSQACDLQQRNIEQVLLCPAPTILEVYSEWRSREEAVGNKTRLKDWESYFKKMKARERVNLCYLGPNNTDPTIVVDWPEGLIPPRVADFRQLHTTPLSYLERLKERPRLRIIGPYLQETSQRLGNFLTRVGLPD